MKSLEQIAEKEYLGRMIIIGRDVSGENDIVVYGITGRSKSSQARKLEFEENSKYTRRMLEFNSENMKVTQYSQPGAAIVVKPTNEEELKKGNPDLLIYEAMIMSICGIAVSNGKQTQNIFEEIYRFQKMFNNLLDATSVLAGAFREWEYEPDAPNYTPRIGGLALHRYNFATLAIARRSSEDRPFEKNFFEFPLTAGEGKMIATYTGVNQNPLPSFAGEPLDVKLEGKTAEEVAEAVYSSLNPAFRVAVASVFKNKTGSEYSSYTYRDYSYTHHIINRCERGE